MKTFLARALAVATIAGAAAFGTSGIASAATVGEQPFGVAWRHLEGEAYAVALDSARNQCPNRNNVSLVTRSTWPAGGDPKNGYWAFVQVRCN
ncbi:hypothetical protein RKE30_38060 [Streptomyces sp. Li-HN-5-11]|uniref:hypothetical protein n=1 Tax=Streptomyces sp. Li-HN-5-11 TaxID=3075432 RepID=UPI0028A93EA2|nr:hypothetical protein [Streptomyces sp. Li-HN-5-11]WNM35758.1 hypothetical protein RKE30_38060 [Streptomyces sp. Li-HN-5-11]